MQTFAIFVKNSLKMNILMIKTLQIQKSLSLYSRMQRCCIHLHNCNLKCSAPKEIPIVFHNGFKYDYQFIIKELVGELEGQFTCLIENTEKRRTCVYSKQKKKLYKLRKMEKKLQKPYSTDKNLFIVRVFWQVHYQILLIIMKYTKF